ncbi:hypothetical protein BaRGS_00025369 [Batillaria attramentaria]|uniref:Uncharacterized protein n=1 Tax=Batillaria attramentaria TaxID=370345 RepID=A0ABD0K8K0_9CAEN
MRNELISDSDSVLPTVPVTVSGHSSGLGADRWLYLSAQLLSTHTVTSRPSLSTHTDQPSVIVYTHQPSVIGAQAARQLMAKYSRMCGTAWKRVKLYSLLPAKESTLIPLRQPASVYKH